MTSQNDQGATSPQTVELTVLNQMPSTDFTTSLRLHQEWGLNWVDLWGQIYGVPAVDDLDVGTAEKAAAEIEEAGLRVYCLSTRIFDDHVEQGESEFRRKHFDQLKRSLEIAAIVKPHFVRLIAGRLSTEPRSTQNRVNALEQQYPWVRDLYRAAIRAIQDAGYQATIENEVHECFLATPTEFVDFAEWLDLKGLSTTLTWDIQNNWQMGSFPTMEAYSVLSPYLGYVHLKGGISGANDDLEWRSALADASWPVVDIASAVVRDGISPVICLNPSHGKDRPGVERDLTSVTKQDIDYLRNHVKGIN